MKRLEVTLKLTTALAIVACALAVTAASAFAVSIEPLSTKFEGTTTEQVIWKNQSFGSWKCEKATLSGTTNSTKTNFVEMTPAFSGCSGTIGGGSTPVAYSNKCETEGPPPIPWTVTLNTGGTASLKTACTLVANWNSGLCIMTVPPQTITSGLSWENEGSNLKLRFESLTFKSLKFTPSSFCETLGFKATTLEMSTRVLIKGIHAS